MLLRLERGSSHINCYGNVARADVYRFAKAAADRKATNVQKLSHNWKWDQIDYVEQLGRDVDLRDDRNEPARE
jgi:hypothetical protein